MSSANFSTQSTQNYRKPLQSNYSTKQDYQQNPNNNYQQPQITDHFKNLQQLMNDLSEAANDNWFNQPATSTYSSNFQPTSYSTNSQYSSPFSAESQFSFTNNNFNDTKQIKEDTINNTDSTETENEEQEKFNQYTYYAYNEMIEKENNKESTKQVEEVGCDHCTDDNHKIQETTGYKNTFSSDFDYYLNNSVFGNYGTFENTMQFLNAFNSNAFNKFTSNIFSSYASNSAEVSGYGNPYEVSGHNEIDGRIDDVRQGQIGDCWLMAAIDAVSKDKDGKRIIKEMIKKSPNGGWDVHFKGCPEKSFHVSEDELYGGRYGHWSKGDPDVKILEIAASKWRRQYEGRSLDGGFPGQAMKLLTGQENDVGHSRAQIRALLDRAADDKDGLSMTGCCRQNNRGLGLVANHAYSIESVDKNNQTVTLKNPWDNSKPITISYDQFLNAFDQASLQHEANDGDNIIDGDDNIIDGDDKDKDKDQNINIDDKFMKGLLTNMMQMFSSMMQMMMMIMKNNFTNNNNFMNDEEQNGLLPIPDINFIS